MKYIRTQEGHIYEYVEQRIHKTQHEKFGLYRHNLNSEYEPIISQADTIEELCDLYIDEETKTIFHKYNGYVINWHTNLVYSLKELIKEFHSIKGAIYTDKGLIYVAKMDSEGCLKLL